jgi:hypothetical protein
VPTFSRWALVSLCHRRLSLRAGARASWVLGILVAGAGAGIAVLGENREYLVPEMAVWLAWCMTPLLFGAASAPRERDRREGIESLVTLRGVGSAELAAARTLAAMLGVLWRMAVPSILLTLALASLEPLRDAAMHGALLLVFAGAAALLLGTVASLCGEAAGARGRELLVAVVLVPWVIADVTSSPAWSIPGLLGTSLDVLDVLAMGAPT